MSITKQALVLGRTSRDVARQHRNQFTLQEIIDWSKKVGCSESDTMVLCMGDQDQILGRVTDVMTVGQEIILIVSKGRARPISIGELSDLLGSKAGWIVKIDHRPIIGLLHRFNIPELIIRSKELIDA